MRKSLGRAMICAFGVLIVVCALLLVADLNLRLGKAQESQVAEQHEDSVPPTPLPTPSPEIHCCRDTVDGGTFLFEEEPGMCWYIVGHECINHSPACSWDCDLCEAGPHYSTIAPCLPEGWEAAEWLEEYNKQWLEEQGLTP
jgi:hypothetical protein